MPALFTPGSPNMFANLFANLRAAKVPVTLKEYLLLIEAVNADLAG